MLPSVSVGWGGGLEYHASPLGTRSPSMDLTDAIGQNNIQNGWNRGGVGIADDYYNGVYGGLSNLVGGLQNHKPGAFYFGDFYFQKHECQHQTKTVYLLRYDGSGIYLNTRNASAGHFNFRSHSGRGVEFLSPSGNTEIQTHELCAIVHNGVLFFLGAFQHHSLNPLTSSWKTIKDWNIVNHAEGGTGGDGGNVHEPRRRLYGAFAIHKKKRVGKDFRDAAGNMTRFSNSVSLSGAATNSECLNACDAISWGGNIIFANHVDIVEFPGGSGVPRFIERNDAEQSAKCFLSYPSGGFVDGEKVGQERLMMLTSSGVLKDILFPGDPGHNPSGQPHLGPGFGVASGRPYGTRTLVNIGLLVQDFQGPKVRSNGQLGRLLDSTTEPTRSCLLKQFNNKLHAFFISAASGYYHFECDGEPSNLDNWEDRTAFLPDEFKLFDGDMYGYTDDHFGSLVCQHVAKSNIGFQGIVGGDRGAGGWSIFSLNQEGTWEKQSRGGSNGPSYGLIPYDPFGAYVQIPSGAFASNPEVIPSTDYALVKYDLFSARTQGLKVDLDIDYTIDEGATWHEARQFTDYVTGSGLGEGKTGLSASPDGDAHEFYWAHVSDVGFNGQQRARVRIRPKNFRNP